MIRRPLPFIVVTVLLLACACSPAQMPASSTESETLPTAPPMPTNTPQLPSNELPPSTHLSAVLTGSGAVDRSLPTYDDLMTGASTAPLDDGAFALPEAAALPAVVFEDHLHLSASGETGGSELIRDDLNYATDPARLQFPEFDLEVLQDGSYLIPVTQDLVIIGHP